MKFRKWADENWVEGNIFPPGMTNEEAIQFLVEYLLGEDWCISYPCGQEQANTEIVYAILKKYSKRFRKEEKNGK